MAILRERIEARFTAMGHWITSHPLLVLALFIVLVAALATQAPRLTFDPSTEGFFRPSDPTIQHYNEFREQFGRDEVIIIAVESDHLFSLPMLKQLTALHGAIEAEVPHVKEVTSMVNARNTRGQRDELIVEDLLEHPPRNDADLARLRERVMSNPLYLNQLISEDGRLTTMVVRTETYSAQGGDGAEEPGLDNFDTNAGSGFAPAAGSAGANGQGSAGGADNTHSASGRLYLTDAENSAVVQGIESVAARFQGPDFTLHVAGSPAVTDFLKRHMQQDMRRFMLLAILAIAIMLALLFRRVSGVVLPLLTVLLSIVSTVGVMALAGVAFKVPTTILPSFLLAVGIGASVHMLAIFYRRFDEQGDRRASIVYALGHSGLPIVMTSVTTAAGLASFATAAMAPVADLGIVAAGGVMLSLVFTVALLPALIALIPLRRHTPPAQRSKPPLLDRGLAALGDFATRHWKGVLIVTAVLVLGALAGVTRLRFSHNPVGWFPQSSGVYRATKVIDRDLKGSVTIEAVVDTGKENGLYDPQLMAGLDELGRYALTIKNADGQPAVGKVWSLVDLLKEINQALHENDPAYYRIPTDRELIAQELLLFENSGSDDLEDLVDSLFSKARMTVKIPWDDATKMVGTIDQLRTKAESLLGASGQVTVTGITVLLAKSIDNLRSSMESSYLIALIVISLLMILLIGSVRIGLLSMVPNLAPIALTLGFMGWVGIPMDAFTLLTGSIALGLAVDDTIHFFHNFRRYHLATGNAKAAVHATLLSTGRAMVVTTLVLVAGFWLFMFASMNNLFNFGLLTGLALAIALLADLVVSPALIMIIHREPARE
ncbi:MAG: MMPL family transporter [Candidatus Lambdaproteobacteria bacterium]|nr:MMPL family transporter [Candidatus Lambdaproteobacteria bacterium]